MSPSRTTRAHGGLGLGLSLVKYVVEGHGGSVRADSAGDGRGATVTIRLLIHRAGNVLTPEIPTPLALTSKLADVSGMRVLVIDDDADSRQVMTAHLEQQGISVVTAASAEEALGIVQREPVKALLVDVAMPGQDGYTFIRMIRASASADIARLPAAAVTAFATPTDRDLALHAGFQAHLAKPATSATLEHVLLQLLVHGAAPSPSDSSSTVALPPGAHITCECKSS